MAWVVDSCVLLDLLIPDPNFAEAALTCLNRYSAEGLVVSPITYLELGPAFCGDTAQQDAFLREKKVRGIKSWEVADTDASYQLWHDCVLRKRRGLAPKRPIADALIAGFAMRWQGLITRNVNDFRVISPTLPLIDPTHLS